MTRRTLAHDLSPARAALTAGGVALVPTDTVYGLAIRPGFPDAVRRLFAMKGRPDGRNLPIMVAATDDLDALGVVVTPQARTLFDAFAPGPLTVAMGLRPGAAPAWLDGRVEVGVRIPDDPALLDLLRELGPLLVTSANRHGEPTPERAPDVLAALLEQPDAVVDGGPRPVVPSTLVNCNLPEPVVEREGVLPAAEIARVLA